MKKPKPEEYPILSFRTPADFESWLAKNHNKVRGIWLRLFKKDSGEVSMTYLEALHEALCYGWRDGQAKKHDDQSWIQKFTPRGPKSIWSKRNTKFVEELMAQGRMQPAGLAEVERAKADGRWQKAYDSPSEMTIPDEFIKAVNKNKKAKAFFETLNKTNRYAIAWRLQTAKKPETKERRIKMIVKMLAKGEKFH